MFLYDNQTNLIHISDVIKIIKHFFEFLIKHF